MPGRTHRRVIGLGNVWRGDDGAGPACVAALQGLVPRDVELIGSDGEPATLLTLLADAAEVWLIDACVSGAPAGTVHHIDVVRCSLPGAGLATSSHGVGLATVLELARAIGELPPCCRVFAIEADNCAPGEPLSAAVRAAVAAVAEQIRRDLQAVPATQP